VSDQANLPRSVWGKFAWSDTYHVDMAGVGALDFGDDLHGTFDFGFNAPGGSYFRAVGTKGRLYSPYGFHAPEGEPGLILTVGNDTQRLVVPQTNGYMLEVQDLSEAIRGVHAPLYGGEPLDATQRVIDAAYAADKRGQSVTI
jgi:predicted dehydrogenase